MLCSALFPAVPLPMGIFVPRVCLSRAHALPQGIGDPSVLSPSSSELITWVHSFEVMERYWRCLYMGWPRVGSYEVEMKASSVQHYVFSSAQCRFESGLKNGNGRGSLLVLLLRPCACWGRLGRPWRPLFQRWYEECSIRKGSLALWGRNLWGVFQGFFVLKYAY